MASGPDTQPKAGRDQIVDVAMRHFAEHGYRGARVEDIAAEVGVAKGTVFLRFGTKEGLFLGIQRRWGAPGWLEAPGEVVTRALGVLDYWLGPRSSCPRPGSPTGSR
jgi:AcrR family transcriptional regulator